MLHPDGSSAAASVPDGPTSAAVTAVLEGVYGRLVEVLRSHPTGPQAVWGPDHRHSSDPSARQLRRKRQSFEWVAVAFPGWSLWQVHLGIVPLGPGALALGLHWQEAVTGLLPPKVAELGHHGIGVRFAEGSGEHQADVLVLAYLAYPHDRAVQLISDVALDFAHSLHALLAVGPTAQFVRQGDPHDL